MPGDRPTGRLAVSPHSSDASVEDRAVAVTTAFTGKPASSNAPNPQAVSLPSLCAGDAAEALGKRGVTRCACFSELKW
jgi:hypothetical protein